MDAERTERSLRALARQEGSNGDCLPIKAVMLMLELRDERIKDLSEFQRAVLLERRPRGNPTARRADCAQAGDSDAA